MSFFSEPNQKERMNVKFSGLALIAVLLACSPKTAELINNNELPASETPILTQLDLINLSEDRVRVQIDPGMFTTDTVLFRLPKVVQGTYDVSNFGSFVEDLTAYSMSGEPIDAIQHDVNTWKIPNTSGLDRIEYYVNDTFDIERTETPTPFSPSGTNIHPEAFVLNLHGFVGYFDEMLDSEYEISVIAQPELKKSSALPLVRSEMDDDSTKVIDTYFAERYFEVTDNPMMYGDLEIEEFQVGDIKIVLSLYAPNGTHDAATIKEVIYEMMEAQKNYLGEMNSTPRYDVFVYMPGNGEEEPTGFGALEHHTSTVVVLPEWMSPEQMEESMIDVVSHEFFHIVTPLTVHSEDVHYFDYNDPTFSKHLWMYEGVTEYFASHFQVYEDLQPRSVFYEKLEEKIEYSITLNDSMSFTKMSEFVIDEPYASNYINVYMKGALIGMCMDILLREASNGERSMLSLMKELSARYGMDQPFVDDQLIAEITDMTYPVIGDFLQTHVVGTTPINYGEFFTKVGLEFGEVEQQTSFFFEETDIMQAQTPYIDVDMQSGEIYFREVELNSALKALGVESGDILKSLNGVEYTLQNINSSGIVPMSFQWAPDFKIEMVVVRDGEELTLTGVAGAPTVMAKQLQEDEDATVAQIQLRNAWLEK